MSVPNVLPFGPRDSAVDRQEIVDTLHRMLDSRTHLAGFPSNLKLALKERVWENERIFAGGTRQGPVTFDAFVREPYPVGLGATYEVVENLIRSDAEAIAMWTEVSRRGQGSRTDLVSNIHDVAPDRPSGTTLEAGVRKLKKAAEEGNPDAARELALVLSGEKKVHTGCVDAGLRKNTRIDPDVRDRAAQSLAERIVSNFPADEIDAAKADAFASGAKALGIALANLTGESIMDRRFGR